MKEEQATSPHSRKTSSQRIDELRTYLLKRVKLLKDQQTKFLDLEAAIRTLF